MMLFAMQATPNYGVTYGPPARVSSEMVSSSSPPFYVIKWQDEGMWVYKMTHPQQLDLCFRG